MLWNVIRHFRPGIILRNRLKLQSNQLILLLSYFKTSYRHLLKHKLTFGFRLGGLTLAILAFLIISIYVSFQLSFDKFHLNYERIYRVNSIRREGSNEIKCASTPSALGAELKSQFPEVKSYTIMSEWGSALMRCDDKLFRSNSVIEANSTVFDVFSFEFISGDKTALTRPDGIVISETLAQQLFGSENPLHKLISFPDRFNQILEVRAVIKDLPPNSSFDVKAIVAYGALRDKGDGPLYSWSTEYGGELFIQLHDKADPNALGKKIQPLLAKNIPKHFDKSENDFRTYLQPLSNIYMGESVKWEFDRKGNPVYIYIYISLAVFLLVIAVINYLNVSISDFSFRNKEIGVRKVLGARKKQIVYQIAFETILHCVLALILSVGILYIIFPQVLQALDFNLRFSMLLQRSVIIGVSATMFMLILLSTTYPAYCLSVNNPINDLKRKQVIGGNFSINRILLVAQFAISVFCISATWVTGSQLQYIQTKDIGFDRNNLLEVFMPDRYPVEKAPVLKNEISKIIGVESASFSYYHMTAVPYFNAWYKIEDKNEMKHVRLNEMFVDEDFLKTMGIKLVDGRNFVSKSEFKTAFIVNESAVKEFGWTNPIGKKMAVGHEKEEGGIWSEGNVVGVVKDFNTRSLHNQIEPVVLRLQYDSWPGYCLNVRYSGAESEIVASLKTVYEQVLPGFLMDYGRVNERYENQYVTERKAYNALQSATWVILLISCIGIFSMSVYISYKRQKEFGIRKVVGASVAQITFLHINHFLRIGFLANLLALPLAYYLMKEWLSGFAYKAETSLLQFVSFGLILLVLIILSAGYSAWKSGRMNPVDVIKME
jgi:putative ABC transport system permease protein